MKQISAFLTATLLFTFVSCNNDNTTKEEPKATTENTTTAKTSEPLAFQPFTVTLIQHKVKDFGKWLTVYEGDDPARKASGLIEIGLGRGLDNNNEVTAAFKTEDVQKAKDFTQSPGLKAAMQKASM